MTTQLRPLRQKTIGVLGGMSNQATGEYYRLLNEKLNDRLGGWDNGEIVIVSVNFGNIEFFVRNGLWDEAKAYLASKVDVLEAAEVDVIVCVSNTMHRVVVPIMAERETPFIHIANPTGRAIQNAGLKTVALLGTLATMHSETLAAYYRDHFSVEVIVPVDSDAVDIDRIIFSELVRRKLFPESKKRYLEIVEKLKAMGAQGVILGCTEIFLLIDQADLPDFPVFNTTALHVDACVKFAVGTLRV